MPVHRRHATENHRGAMLTEAALASLQLTLGAPAPRSRIPDSPISADVAASVIRDELSLDGNARLNLATFVTTSMEPQADELIALCLDKNMVDKDEYPQTAELEQRCVSMLADLWN